MWFFKYEKNFPTFGMCWWRSLKMGGNFEKLNARFPRLFHKWVSRISSLIPSYDFHLSWCSFKWKQLLSWTKCQMHAHIWSKLHPNLYENSRSNRPSKSSSNITCTPFFYFDVFTMAHIHLKFPKNHIWLMIVYKLICLQNKIILICFWVVNQSKRSIY
jgi:hypothetical protein